MARIVEGAPSKTLEKRFKAALSSSETPTNKEVDHGKYSAVVVFGTARAEEGKKFYEHARELGREIVRQMPDLDRIITGGGPGIMEAVLKGASEARDELESQGIPVRTKTYGLRIKTPFEEKDNPWIDAGNLYMYDKFGPRLEDFRAMTTVGVYYEPGGFGTGLELFDRLQHKQFDQVHKSARTILDPIQYTNLLKWCEEFMINYPQSIGERPLISHGDLDGLILEKDIPTIVQHLKGGFEDWKADRVKHGLPDAIPASRRLHDTNEPSHGIPGHEPWTQLRIAPPRDYNSQP